MQRRVEEGLMARLGLESTAMGTVAAGPGLPAPGAVPLCFSSDSQFLPWGLCSRWGLIISLPPGSFHGQLIGKVWSCMPAVLAACSWRWERSKHLSIRRADNVMGAGGLRLSVDSWDGSVIQPDGAHQIFSSQGVYKGLSWAAHKQKGARGQASGRGAGLGFLFGNEALACCIEGNGWG